MTRPHAWFEDDDQHNPPPSSQTLDRAALYGLAGDVVLAIEPHTEADPVAILAQFLIAAGNAIGRGPYWQVEGDRHGPNLFGVLVGETAKGRKGTSWGRVRQVMEIADPQWAAATNGCIDSGLSSGEGVIWRLRDPLKRGEEITDPGVAEKRLLLVESEFSGALTVMRREGNTVSRVVRDGWDRGDLGSLTKNSPVRATGAHISIIGHITGDELRAMLDNVSIANGYANRFLWLIVRRANILPFGGALDKETVVDLGRRTREVIETARRVQEVTMTADAREAWRRIYPALSDAKPGLLGAITARGEAQTIRIALVHALLDGRSEISRDHLKAALALWEYAEASVTSIWGDKLGDPVADTILRALRQVGDAGMTRTAIRDLLGRHGKVSQIDRALDLLRAAGKSRVETRETGGRPGEYWFATTEGR